LGCDRTGITISFLKIWDPTLAKTGLLTGPDLPTGRPLGGPGWMTGTRRIYPFGFFWILYIWVNIDSSKIIFNSLQKPTNLNSSYLFYLLPVNHHINQANFNLLILRFYDFHGNSQLRCAFHEKGWKMVKGRSEKRRERIEEEIGI
jgi:hypothetical protein